MLEPLTLKEIAITHHTLQEMYDAYVSRQAYRDVRNYIRETVFLMCEEIDIEE